MKKWYHWFYLSIIFAIAGIINCFDGKPMIAAIGQVSIPTIFGFIQFLCDKKGDKGKKVFQYISIAVIIMLAIWLIYLVLRVLK